MSQTYAGRTWPGSRLAAPSLSDVGMQQRAPVRGVERLAAAPGLEVDRPSDRQEGRQVRDRVAHPVARAGALQVHGLVQVVRARRVDREERQVGQVESSAAAGGRPPRLRPPRPPAGKPSGISSSARMSAKAWVSSAGSTVPVVGVPPPARGGIVIIRSGMPPTLRRPQRARGTCGA